MKSLDTIINKLDVHINPNYNKPLCILSDDENVNESSLEKSKIVLSDTVSTP